MGITAENLKARKKGIGGTDSAAILGVSPWKTPLDVYLDKIGEGEPIEETEAMRWGNLLEDVVANEAAEKMGVKVRRSNKTLVNPQLPWMIGHIDREIVGDKSIMEVKTAGRKNDEWGDEGTDRIPQQYVAQVAHYLAVLNAERAYVPVLFMLERKMLIYEVKRDLELEKIVIQAENDFWVNHVLQRTPPPTTNLADLRKRWPLGDGGVIEADEEMEDTAERLVKLKAAQRLLANERDRLELLVKEYMEDKDELIDPAGQTLVTYKTRKSNYLDTKALKEQRPDVDSEFRKKRVSRSFLIKNPRKLEMLEGNQQRLLNYI